jgi:hypothetical protein
MLGGSNPRYNSNPEKEVTTEGGGANEDTVSPPLQRNRDDTSSEITSFEVTSC